jgi:hypothetical protein
MKLRQERERVSVESLHSHAVAARVIDNSCRTHH